MLRLYRNTEGADGNGAPPASTTAQVDNQNNPPAPAYTPPSLDMATALPPEYREKPAFKGKDFVTLVKEHDNLQTLLGQRPAGIPTDKATPEEWDKFLGTIRPKDSSEYQFPETEFSKAQARSPEYEKALREIMSEAGMTKHGFPKAVAKIEGILGEARKQADAKAEAEKTARETEFEGLLDKSFGTQKQAVLDRTKSLMAEVVNPAHKDTVSKALDGISNEALFAFTQVLEGVRAKYITEDNPPGNGTPAGADLAGMQAEAESLMKSPAYRDFRDASHEATKAKVQSLFQRIAVSRK
jgi:hypothetical protein